MDVCWILQEESERKKEREGDKIEPAGRARGSVAPAVGGIGRVSGNAGLAVVVIALCASRCDE